MVLFENSTIKLEYNPATDILEVAYPDLHIYLIPKIKYSIDILIETIINYDIKKVMLDSSKTIESVNEEDGKEVARYLAEGMANTRVQKLARVQSPSAEVEIRAESNIRSIKEAGLLPFQLENFNNKNTAVEWLQI